MGLSISQTFARIGIETTPGRMEIQTRAASLDIQHKDIQLNIHTELPKVIIDQHDAFSSAGLKGNMEIVADAAQRGYQQLLDYIGKTAEDGEALAAIENGGNPIADIAFRDSFTEHEFGIDYIPKVGPKIDVTGSISFNPDHVNGIGMRNGVVINVTPGSVNVNYTPSKLKIFMAQYPSIHISYTGKKVDIYI